MDRVYAIFKASCSDSSRCGVEVVNKCSRRTGFAFVRAFHRLPSSSGTAERFYLTQSLSVQASQKLENTEGGNKLVRVSFFKTFRHPDQVSTGKKNVCMYYYLLTAEGRSVRLPLENSFSVIK